MGLGVYSMNKHGIWIIQHVELAAAQQHLGTNSNPCFSVKIILNYDILFSGHHIAPSLTVICGSMVLLNLTLCNSFQTNGSAPSALSPFFSFFDN
jgi:hypothetical protein